MLQSFAIDNTSDILGSNHETRVTAVEPGLARKVWALTTPMIWSEVSEVNASTDSTIETLTRTNRLPHHPILFIKFRNVLSD
jgi:hypothetical protein